MVDFTPWLTERPNINILSDTQAPELTEFSINPTTVDFSDGSTEKDVEITAHVTDETGVGEIAIFFTTVNPIGETTVNAHETLTLDTHTVDVPDGPPVLTFVSGDAKDGVYKGTFHLHDFNTDGLWKVSRLYLRDTSGVSFEVNEPDKAHGITTNEVVNYFEGKGFPSGFEVVKKSKDTDGDCLTDDEENAIGTDPNNADTDGDGLPDGLEAANFDMENECKPIKIDMKRYRADPLRRDIFLEIDWMGTECVKGVFTTTCHNHKPNPDAIQDVIDAFDKSPITGPYKNVKKGINLHAQVDEMIPHEDMLLMKGSDGKVDWTRFDAIKKQYFGTTTERFISGATDDKLRSLFHYVIFAHSITREGNTGIAELPGNDLVVALGSRTGSQGSRDEQAGTLMHELGHNLGLGHGGRNPITNEYDNTNCKPNYLSVMSYSQIYSNLIPNRPLDYSSEQLPTLDENSLDEQKGISSLATTTYGPTLIYPRTTQGTQSIDWSNGDANGDGIADNDTGVKSDINKISPYNILLSTGCDGWDQFGSKLYGFNDWANLIFFSKATPDYADGVHTMPVPEEMDEATYEEFSAQGRLVNGKIVTVDIKPGTNENSINLKNHGVVSVAVLSSDTFDASKLDVEKTRFGAHGVEAKEAHDMVHVEDVNGDGLLDAVLHFKVSDTGFNNSSKEGWFSGETVDGDQVRGSDSIVVRK